MTEQPSTAPEPPRTPADAGNPLLGPTPAEFAVHEVMGPADQKRLLFTIRTASTTLSLFLTREEAAQLAKQVGQAAAQMGGLVVPTIGMN